MSKIDFTKPLEFVQDGYQVISTLPCKLSNPYLQRTTVDGKVVDFKLIRKED